VRSSIKCRTDLKSPLKTTWILQWRDFKKQLSIWCKFAFGRVYRNRSPIAKRQPFRTWCHPPEQPWAITSFCRTRIHSPKSARTLLKNVWRRRLHAIAQKWTDTHCAITSANNFSGPQMVTARISPVLLAGSVRKTDSQQAVYLSYTYEPSPRLQQYQFLSTPIQYISTTRA